jgi:hypothetical protein
MLLCLLSFSARAVEPTHPAKQQSIMSTYSDGETMNIIKLNLLSLPMKNISLQYERVLNRKFSAALGFRYMPSSSLPFSKLIADKFAGGDTADEAADLLSNFKISGFALTPEVRLYLSKKGYGQGFYLAAYYRYAHFNTSGLSYTVKNANNDVLANVNLAGSVNTNTVGLMIGSQWKIGKFVDLDWWILGPNAGSIKGTLTGTSDKPLKPEDQKTLDEQLGDIDLPFVKESHTVTSNTASISLKGPWAGLRVGLALGVHF